MREDINSYFRHLHQHPGGYWLADASRSVSYPEDGNAACFAIEDGSFWFQHRNAVVTEAIRGFPPNTPFFDIGGGNGYVAKGLEAADLSVVLIEPGPAGALNAVQRGVKHVVCATLEDAKFLPGSIPSAGLFDVLEHIEDDIGFLRNLGSLLRTGGRVYLTVPAFNLLWSDEDVEAGHYRRYTAASLSKCLASAGFRVEYTTYFFSLLPIPVFLLRSIPSFLGMRKDASVDDYRSEHSMGGITGAVMNRSFASELKRIHRKKFIPVGGSCLAVAVNERARGNSG
jgi:SAM-dependent methyltransferase